LLWATLAWQAQGPPALLARATLLGFALGSIGTNLFHKWAHAGRVPRGVRWLQRHRLILSPAAHAVHHRHYTGGYCVTSGWMNALLDPVGFFPRVERWVRRWIGCRPTEERH
jgi:sterol desaturase/sphingolipid hydroxylase (fatty acid hydroxylase superfamily)